MAETELLQLQIKVDGVNDLKNAAKAFKSFGEASLGNVKASFVGFEAGAGGAAKATAAFAGAVKNASSSFNNVKNAASAASAANNTFKATAVNAAQGEKQLSDSEKAVLNSLEELIKKQAQRTEELIKQAQATQQNQAAGAGLKQQLTEESKAAEQAKQKLAELRDAQTDLAKQQKILNIEKQASKSASQEATALLARESAADRAAHNQREANRLAETASIKAANAAKEAVEKNNSSKLSASEKKAAFERAKIYQEAAQQAVIASQKAFQAQQAVAAANIAMEKKNAAVKEALAQQEKAAKSALYNKEAQEAAKAAQASIDAIRKEVSANQSGVMSIDQARRLSAAIHKAQLAEEKAEVASEMDFEVQKKLAGLKQIASAEAQAAQASINMARKAAAERQAAMDNAIGAQQSARGKAKGVEMDATPKGKGNFAKGIKSIQSGIGKAVDIAKPVAAAFGQFASITGKLVGVLGQAGSAALHFAGTIGGAALSGVKAFVSVLGSVAGAVGNAIGALGRLGGAAGSASGHMAALGASAAGAAASGIKNMAEAGMHAIGVLAKFGAAGAAAGLALGTVWSKQAGGFEQAMADLKASLPEQERSKENMDALSEAAGKVGQVTSFSAKEAAVGMGELAAQGFNSADAMKALLPVSQAAELNHVGLAKAAEVGAVAMNAFGLKAEDLTGIFNVQTKAAQMGAIGFEDFQMGIAAGGAVANMAGQDFETFSSTLVALTNAGLSAQDAGTSVKSALLAMMKPTAPAAAAMKELGLSAYDASGKMRPWPDIIKQIEVGTKDMTNEQRDSLLATVAGSDGIRAFGISLQQGSDKLYEYRDALYASDGEMEKSWAISRDTLNAAVDNLKGSIEQLGITIGMSFIPSLKQMVIAKTNNINALIDWEKKYHVVGGSIDKVLKGVMRAEQVAADSAKTFFGALKDGKPPIKEIDEFGNKIKDLSKGWENSAGINKFTALIGQLGLALHPAVAAFQKLRLMMKPVEDAHDRMAGSVTKLNGPFETLNQKLSISEKVYQKLSAAIGVFGDFVSSKVAPAISSLTPYLQANGEGLGALANKVIYLYSTFSPLTNIFRVFEGLISGGVNGAILAFQQNIMNMGVALGLNATDAMNVAANATNVLKGGFSILQQVIGPVIQSVILFGQGLVSGISGPIGQVISRFNEGGATAQGFGKLLAELPTIFANLGQSVGAMLGGFINFGAALLEVGVQSGIVQTGLGLINQAVALVANVVNTLASGIRANMTAISGAVSAVGNAFQVAFDVVGNAVQFVADLISSNMGTIATIIENAGNIATNVFTILGNVFNALKPALTAVFEGILHVADVISSGLNQSMSDGAPIIDILVGALGFLADVFANGIGPSIDIALIPVKLFFETIRAGGNVVKSVMAGDLVGALNSATQGTQNFMSTLTGGFVPSVNSAADAAKSAKEGVSDWGNSTNNAQSSASSMSGFLSNLTGQHNANTSAVNANKSAIDQMKDSMNASSAAMSQTSSQMNTISTMFNKQSTEAQNAFNAFKNYTQAANEGGLSQDNFRASADQALATLSGLDPKLAQAAQAWAISSNKNKEATSSYEENTVQSILNANAQEKVATNLQKGSDAATNISTTMQNSTDGVQALGDSFTQLQSSVDTGITSMKASVASVDFSAEGQRIGASLAEGIAVGIASQAPAVAAAAASAAASAASAAKAAMDIHSPSGVMENEVGSPITMGIVKGISSMTGEVVKAMQEVGGALKDAGLEEVAKQSDMIGKIADNAGKMASALTSIKSAEGISTDVIIEFAATMHDLVVAFVESGKDFDEKALAGAAAYAEASGKIADAGSKMADFLAKLKDFSGVSSEAIGNFSANVLQLVNAFVTASEKFKEEGLQAASVFADTAAKMADNGLKMLTFFKQLQKFSMIDQGVIDMYNANVYMLVNAFVAASESFSTEMLSAASDYADTSGTVADNGLKMLDLLKQLQGYSMVSQGTIDMFNANIYQVINAFAASASSFEDGMVTSAEDYSKSAGVVAENAGKALEFLTNLQGYSEVSQGVIDVFNANVYQLVNAFGAAAVQFDTDMLAATNTYAETVGKIAEVLGPAIEGLSKLQDYSAIATEDLMAFMLDLNDLVNVFVEQSQNFDQKTMEAAASYATSAGNIADTIGKGVSGLSALSNYKTVAVKYIDAFSKDLFYVVGLFVTQSAQFKDEGLKAASVFSESAGKVAETIGKGVEGFTALKDYSSIPAETLNSFLNDLKQAVILASQAAASMQTDMMDEVNVFGGAVEALFNGFKSAIEVFKGLEEYKSTPSTVIADFVNEIGITVGLAAQLAAKADQEMIAQVTAFSTAVNSIFSGLKTALELFKSLEEFKGIPAQQITALLTAIDITIQYMSKAEQSAEQFKLRSAGFEKNMKEGFLAIREAISMALEATKQAAKAATEVDQIPNPPEGGGGGKKASGGKIPGRASGGTAPRSYIVGENGPEVFYPGGQGGYVVNNPTARMNDLLGGGNEASTNNITYNVTINVNGANNPEASAVAVRKEIQRLGRRAGTLASTGGSIT